MRHKVKKFTLGRKRAQRKALMRALAESLVLHGAIKTTHAKARALRTVIEPMVTKARRGTLHDRRIIGKILYTDKALKQLFEKIAPRYKTRPGGYTRIVKLGPRYNDAAPMVRIEFV